MNATQMPVTEIGNSYNRDCELVTRFSCHGHVVTIRRSPDSGTPQEESCDCQGFRFRRTCKHITAVYESGLLTCFADGVNEVNDDE